MDKFFTQDILQYYRYGSYFHEKWLGRAKKASLMLSDD